MSMQIINNANVNERRINKKFLLLMKRWSRTVTNSSEVRISYIEQRLLNPSRGLSLEEWRVVYFWVNFLKEYQITSQSFFFMWLPPPPFLRLTVAKLVSWISFAWKSKPGTRWKALMMSCGLDCPLQILSDILFKNRQYRVSHKYCNNNFYFLSIT